MSIELRLRYLRISQVFRVLAILYLLGLLAGVAWFLWWSFHAYGEKVTLGLACFVNVPGVLLVWACPFCYLSDHYHKKAAKEF